MFNDLTLYKSKVELYRDSLQCFIPKYLLDKNPELLIEGKNLLKKYPKFQTVRNMVSAFMNDKWLTICPICNKRRIRYQSCIRRKENITCGHPECVKKQIQNTSLTKYGTTSPMNRKEQLEKRRKNGWYVWNAHVDRKHNTKFINHFKKIKKRLKENHLSGIDTIEDYKGVLEEKTGRYLKYSFTCDICGNKIISGLHSVDFPYCKICHPPKIKNCLIINDNGKAVTARVSSGENDLFEFCKSLDKNITRNKRNIFENKKKEIDIFSALKNIGIEYNGLYWHSEKCRPKLFHWDKTNEAVNKGIRLIHIFEDEWIYKKDKVKSILRKIFDKPKKLINATDCNIKEIDILSCKRFLEKYHIDGYAPASIYLGLFYKHRLISVISIAKSRVNKEYNFEIVRYANINNFKIKDDLKYLLEYFYKNYPGKIICKLNRRWHTGNSFIKCGFKIKEIKKPECYYIKNNNRFHRKNFIKNTLKNKLEIYNPLLSEVKNMELNGYNRIWDAGSIILEYS